MIRLKVEASKDNLPDVTVAIDKELEKNACPAKIRKQVRLAVEEVFVNICDYSYDSSGGMIEIETDISIPEETVSVITIKIEDAGRQFDPLTCENPYISIPIAQRKLGGLGIFLFRQIMDDVGYEYKDGRNCLTMTKKYEKEQ